MRNFIQRGHTRTFTAPYDVKAGDGFLRGVWFAVANNDAAAGQEVEGDVVGVFALTKSTAAASAIAPNTKVYWDDANKVVTATANGNKLIGASGELGAADGDATVIVALNGTIVS